MLCEFIAARFFTCFKLESGFPGISDSFGAALWALDYGLQMAYSNFSGAMLHVGGQNVFYNVSVERGCSLIMFRWSDFWRLLL